MHYSDVRSYTEYAGVDYSSLGPSSQPHGDLVACTDWEFDTSWYTNTIGQRFSLVCGASILNR